MPSQYPPITLANTQIRPLKSSIVNYTYSLHIVLPATYANSSKTYPVVYLTDGSGLAPLVGSIAESLSAGLEIPRLLIVGIGYSEQEGRYRERDFLPTDASARDPSRRQEFTRSGIRRGQAGAFLRFIRQELQPFIHANYRADPGDNTYMGNSYGGLFGLYALFHHPGTFRRYIIGSPAIHHDNQVIMTCESAYAARHADLPARVFLSVGAREELDDPLIDSSFQFVTNVRTLDKTLRERNYPGLQLTTRVFEGESHVSVLPMTFSWGLRAVWCKTLYTPVAPLPT